MNHKKLILSLVAGAAIMYGAYADAAPKKNPKKRTVAIAKQPYGLEKIVDNHKPEKIPEEKIEIGENSESYLDCSLPIEFHPTQNYKEGRKFPLEGIVIHSTEGSAEGAISWFTNQNSKASSHYLISKEGEIFQFVKDEDTAWHVGKENTKYIGIELEGYHGKGFTKEQYETLGLLCLYLNQKTGVKTIVSHKWVSENKGGTNHADPGPKFYWERLKKELEFYKGCSIKPYFVNYKN